MGLFIAIGIVGAASTVKAIETTNTEEPRTVTTEPQTTRTEHTTTEQKKVTVARLETVKLKNCQNREAEIKNTLSRISDRATKRVDTFDKIATNVEEFYVTKGNVLKNYDLLVARVNSKKTIVKNAILNLPTASTNFVCNGDNPKAVITEFKQNNQYLSNALKEYRTAIKNLIVGVKSVQDTTSETNNTNGEVRL